ncbi:MAG: hypothetical protein JXM73_02375 [Anaerolineae bacterium]|nr:hypothetical protein [Anaerolineae bacterium]
MKNLGLPILDLGIAVCLVLSLTAGVVAQEGYDLSWWTADGGGQTFSTGGGYSLGGTIGQADAGLLSGSGYTLAAGFWSGGTAIYRVYLPLVFRDFP